MNVYCISCDKEMNRQSIVEDKQEKKEVYLCDCGVEVLIIN